MDRNISHNDVKSEAKPRTYKYKYFNMILMSLIHLQAIYGVYLVIFGRAKLFTLIFSVALIITSGWGITAGAHRLWSHRAYKAKWPLRLMLMIFNTIAFQSCVIHWSRDHRIHHKYSDTDADPYNASRGLFFTHVGWLLVQKHPEVIDAGKKVDLSDLKADPILKFQMDFYLILMPIFCFILPTIIPHYGWNESLSIAWFIPVCLRYVYILNVTWFVNSLAHKYGNKPYDKYILPAENPFVSLVSLGEGWHNYHHCFPYDYKAAELPYQLNLTTRFIDAMAKIGWAYDLKVAKNDVIEMRKNRNGMNE